MGESVRKKLDEAKSELSAQTTRFAHEMTKVASDRDAHHITIEQMKKQAEAEVTEKIVAAETQKAALENEIEILNEKFAAQEQKISEQQREANKRQEKLRHESKTKVEAIRQSMSQLEITHAQHTEELKDRARVTLSEHSMEAARKINTVQAKLDVALERHKEYEDRLKAKDEMLGAQNEVGKVEKEKIAAKVAKEKSVLVKAVKKLQAIKVSLEKKLREEESRLENCETERETERQRFANRESQLISERQKTEAKFKEQFQLLEVDSKLTKDEVKRLRTRAVTLLHKLRQSYHKLAEEKSELTLHIEQGVKQHTQEIEKITKDCQQKTTTSLQDQEKRLDEMYMMLVRQQRDNLVGQNNKIVASKAALTQKVQELQLELQRRPSIFRRKVTRTP